MNCPKCGAENIDGVELCKSCNCALASSSQAAFSKSAKISAGLAITSLVLMTLSFSLFYFPALSVSLSLVLIILSFFILSLIALPAIIFGIIALVKIKKSDGQLKGKELVIIGIAAPVVILLIFLIVMQISMPPLVHQIAGRIICGANIIGLGTAMLGYSNGYDGQFPTADKWCDLLVEHTDIGLGSFVCGSETEEGLSNYALNESIIKDSDTSPGNMVFLFETNKPSWNLVGGKELVGTENHQGEGCNILFADYHLRFVKTKDLDSLRWE